jgi:hypothetical protein
LHFLHELGIREHHAHDRIVQRDEGGHHEREAGLDVMADHERAQVLGVLAGNGRWLHGWQGEM